MSQLSSSSLPKKNSGAYEKRIDRSTSLSAIFARAPDFTRSTYMPFSKQSDFSEAHCLHADCLPLGGGEIFCTGSKYFSCCGWSPTQRTSRDAHARADPVRAHEVVNDTASSEPARSGRALRVYSTGTRRLIEPGRCAPNRQVAPSRKSCAFPSAGRYGARAPTRGADPRETGLAFARVFLRFPQRRADRIAANPRPRRGVRRAKRRKRDARFFPSRDFPAPRT